MRKIETKEFKLLTDIIWGWDLGMIDWMLTEEEASEVTEVYQDNIIPLFKTRISVTEEEFDYLVGYALIARLDIDEAELIEKERICSHIENWTVDGDLYYLSEVAVHKDYRANGISFMRLMTGVIKYCKDNNVDIIYTTAVSDDSREIMTNKLISHAVTLLEIKEENRQVYKIDITKL